MTASHRHQAAAALGECLAVANCRMHTSTEGQKLHENLAPVLVIISGKSLVFSRKIITSTGFYRYCAPDASAPVVVINQSPPHCMRFVAVLSDPVGGF